MNKFSSIRLIVIFGLISLGLGLSAIPAAAQFTAFVVNEGSETISVIDTATNKVIATIDAGEKPAGIAITPDGKKAYVSQYLNNSIMEIDITNYEIVTQSIPVGERPTELAITPDSSEVYVSNSGSGTVSVINTEQKVETHEIFVGPGPGEIAITPDGSRAYVVHQDENAVSCISIENKNVFPSKIPVGTEPQEIAVTPDGRQAYVPNFGSNNVSVIDVDPSGDNFNSVAAIIPTKIEPQSMAITSDGDRAYVCCNGYITIIDTITNTVVENIGSGCDEKKIVLTPDGSRAYILETENNRVYILDINKIEPILPVFIDVGLNPEDIAISPLQFPVFDLSLDFSSYQGVNNLFYLYFDFQTNNYEFMIPGQNYWGQPADGIGWIIPSQYTASFYKEFDWLDYIGFHPGIDFDTALAWQSYFSGKVFIHGTIDNWNSVGGDGFWFWIKNSDIDIYGESIENGGSRTFDAQTYMEPGDMLYFYLNKKLDHYYDSSHLNWTITVLDPAPTIKLADNQITYLWVDVGKLVDDGIFTHKEYASLTRKLDQASGDLKSGKIRQAKNRIDGFIKKVHLYYNKGILTPAQSAKLEAAAQKIIANLDLLE